MTEVVTVNGYEIKPLADLSGADLSGASLSKANLWGAYLRGADLSGANLRGADLRGADLRESDLRRANLMRADFREADLRGADLYGADLREADLREADLREADLYGADLRNCIGDGLIIKSAQFSMYKCVWYKDPEAGITLNIGCQSHRIVKWQKADPRWIAVMDQGATEWWSKYGQTLLQLVQLSMEDQ